MEICPRLEEFFFFSIAGKEILIKSIGQAIPTYLMGVFKLPKHLHEEIMRYFSRFWWGSSPTKRKIHWFKWKDLCLPKSLGGLNFRDIEGFNQALLAKQVWRILMSSDSLVSKFLKSIYFHNSNILEAERGRQPSYLWRSLLWGRELLSKGLRYRIGDGKNTFMFKDPWLPKESTFRPICINRDLANSRVADYITDSGGWNVEALNRAVIDFDINTIRGVPINTNLQDKLVWHYDRTGKFSVKSGYKLFMNIKLDGIQTSSPTLNRIWTNLWKLKIPTKIKHLCWRALKESIPNNINLNRRGLNLSTVCPICNLHPESTDHCLFVCSRAREIWSLTHNKVFLEEDFHGSFIDRWLKIDANSSLQDLSLVATTCWAIWTDRNKTVHGDPIPPTQIRGRWIREYLDSFVKANSRIDSRRIFYRGKTPSSAPACWTPPPDGIWKLNTDAACSHLESATGLGSSIRDKNGDIVAASSIFLDLALSPLLWLNCEPFLKG